MRGLATGLMAALALGGCALETGGPYASTHERVVHLPGAANLPPASLVVTVMTPDGPGPFPLAIVNHGTDARGVPARQERYRRSYITAYFLSRGYAVAMPMMRGFAGSSGRPALHGCDMTRTGLENAEDIRAVIKGLSKDPKVDTSRIVLAGQSLGGWNALATGALGITGVKAVVNFTGGLVESDCKDVEGSLAQGAADFGAKSRVPTLWFYGDNDRLFPPDTWKAVQARYTAAGGSAVVVDYGVFGEDAHLMPSVIQGLPIWVAPTDAFLGYLKLPATLVYEGYLPPIPPVPATPPTKP